MSPVTISVYCFCLYYVSYCNSYHYYNLSFKILDELGGRNNASLRKMVCEALTDEWEHIRRCFRRVIWNPPGREFFNSVYKFGPERVRVGEMVYRKFFINRLMSRVLFGRDFQKFMPYEVMYRDSRNCRPTLIHVASQQ